MRNADDIIIRTMDLAGMASLLAPFLPAPLARPQLAAINAYLDLLLRWNQRINLTAVRQPEDILTRHFGESLFLAAELFSRDFDPHHRVIDIGSGAGFPGLPIRIYAPVQLTLIESRQRKAAFLREAARTLSFTDVSVFMGRAETYEVGPALAPVTVTMRAVEHFSDVLPIAPGLLKAAVTTHAPAARIALLIGTSQVELTHQLTPEIAWRAPLLVPASKSRVLLVGSLAAQSRVQEFTSFPQIEG